jgi:hypothetical protein
MTCKICCKNQVLQQSRAIQLLGWQRLKSAFALSRVYRILSTTTGRQFRRATHTRNSETSSTTKFSRCSFLNSEIHFPLSVVYSLRWDVMNFKGHILIILRPGADCTRGLAALRQAKAAPVQHLCRVHGATCPLLLWTGGVLRAGNARRPPPSRMSMGRRK